jgi:hypothetical protein
MTSAAQYRVVYLGSLARRDIWTGGGDLETCERVLRKFKRQGRTAWIETTAGVFVPVKGAMRKPAEL